jgi:hypothetical protein
MRRKLNDRYEIRSRDWGARAWAGLPIIYGPVFGEIAPIIRGRSVRCLNQLDLTRVVCLGPSAQTIYKRPALAPSPSIQST